jgi:predicted RNA binding protein YcfA (HicA-like mRNA interferase family)
VHELREFDGVLVASGSKNQPPATERLPGAFSREGVARKYRDLVKLLEDNGWYFHHKRAAAHMNYRHRIKPGSIVGAFGGKLNRNVQTGT